MLNYIVHGAGAIGCVLAARLTQAGCRVGLVARGDHLDVLARDGLHIGGETQGHFELPAAASAHELDVDASTVVLLAMKTQHTLDAVEAHRDLYADLPLFCFQNGVANEEWLTVQGLRAYGVMVRIGARIDKPGAVTHTGARRAQIGCWPYGTDELCAAVVDDLVRGEMSARLEERVADAKWGKLVVNLANAYLALTDLAVQASMCAEADRWFVADVEEEAANVVEAAGISVIMDGKRSLRERIEAMREPGVQDTMGGVGPDRFSYPSTWQDLHFKRPTVEVEYFNGRICELGEHHGIPTPLNRILLERCTDAAARRLGPGTETTNSLRTAAQA